MRRFYHTVLAVCLRRMSVPDSGVYVTVGGMLPQLYAFSYDGRIRKRGRGDVLLQNALVLQRIHL